MPAASCNTVAHFVRARRPCSIRTTETVMHAVTALLTDNG